jgi:hypothetical protein
MVLDEDTELASDSNLTTGISNRLELKKIVYADCSGMGEGCEV